MSLFDMLALSCIHLGLLMPLNLVRSSVSSPFMLRDIKFTSLNTSAAISTGSPVPISSLPVQPPLPYHLPSLALSSCDDGIVWTQGGSQSDCRTGGR
mmetsp:Transcript_137937/g.239835  ORF Transcript_137937/g.239835 Transcript_137937/m.239835 type:complete len:97 (-) Transcript_137937:32-322(-)